MKKRVGYEQVPFDTYRKMAGARREKLPTQHSAMEMYGEFEQAPERRGESFLAQHLRQVTVVDHKNGVFAGTNDLVEKIGGKPATTLEQFIQENRKAFE
jgi:NAD(P)H dehydrogenase (quinone)